MAWGFFLRADDGNRTRVLSLGTRRSRVETTPDLGVQVAGMCMERPTLTVVQGTLRARAGDLHTASNEQGSRGVALLDLHRFGRVRVVWGCRCRCRQNCRRKFSGWSQQNGVGVGSTRVRQSCWVLRWIVVAPDMFLAQAR